MYDIGVVTYILQSSGTAESTFHSSSPVHVCNHIWPDCPEYCSLEKMLRGKFTWAHPTRLDLNTDIIDRHSMIDGGLLKSSNTGHTPIHTSTKVVLETASVKTVE